MQLHRSTEQDLKCDSTEQDVIPEMWIKEHDSIISLNRAGFGMVGQQSRI
jgi:hypothetical protein